MDCLTSKGRDGEEHNIEGRRTCVISLDANFVYAYALMHVAVQGGGVSRGMFVDFSFPT